MVLVCEMLSELRKSIEKYGVFIKLINLFFRFTFFDSCRLVSSRLGPSFADLVTVVCNCKHLDLWLLRATGELVKP